MKATIIHKCFLAAIVALAVAVMSPGTARADATCSSLIPGMFSNLSQRVGPYYNVEITVTKDPLTDVTYSTGTVELNGSYLWGRANLLFSDRLNGFQRFVANASENIQVWITQNGQVWIWNNNYSYWIVSDTDMSCTGNLISKYVPGLGLVTIAVRNLGGLQ
jgi:hypothetical protein